MASPLNTGKKSVNLSAPVRGSRIRRDPPPIVKKVEVHDVEERETRTVVVGVISFALALTAIMIGAASFYGWSPSQYTIHIRSDG